MSHVHQQANRLQIKILDRIYRTTDRMFMWLMIVQVIGGVIAAIALSPRTYSGTTSFVHPHVIFAAVMGCLIAAPVVVSALLWPGRTQTRFIVSICQPLMSALLIHISGGRIETHFHVFGSLAFLAFYRDWRILVPATLVIALDHMIRGVYLPLSVYGLPGGTEWRFIEHAGWVIFEDVILVAYCVRGVQEVRAIAERQSELEATNQSIEATVVERTNQLRLSHQRSSAILENALDAIVTIDSRGKILEFNPAAAAIFGVPEEAAIGSLFPDLFALGESKDGIQACFQSDGSREEILVNKHLDYTGRRVDGEEFAMELSMVDLEIDGQTIYTAFIRDVSERKRLESKLSQSNKLESLGQLATGVAHEINTPNQYIGDNVRYVDDSFVDLSKLIGRYRSAIDEAKEGQLDSAEIESLQAEERKADLEFLMEEVPRALTQALEGVDRVAAIVRAMKEFSHPGIQSITMVDFNRVITSTVTVARNEWKYVADVEFDLMPNLPTLQGNPGELGQVILNLVVNAAHAIRDHRAEGVMGKISISTCVEGDQVVMRLRDDGGGIPEGVQKRMFDPFFTTKGVGIGTGQGLSIVHSVIVAGHGGEIEVDSEVGAGTEFVIRLPLDGRGQSGERNAA